MIVNEKAVSQLLASVFKDTAEFVNEFDLVVLAMADVVTEVVVVTVADEDVVVEVVVVALVEQVNTLVENWLT